MCSRCRLASYSDALAVDELLAPMSSTWTREMMVVRLRRILPAAQKYRESHSIVSICTQTLLLIYEVDDAVGELHRVLKPGGVLLTTLPGISQLCPPKMIGAGWTIGASLGIPPSGRSRGISGCTIHEVETYGNVLAAVAFLHGLVVEEFSPEELDYHDPDYEVIIAIRARKASGGEA